MLKRTYLLSGIAVLTALGLMACGSSGSGQTEAKGSVSGNSGTEAAANEESLNFTMALVDNSQSNYYKGAEKIAELVNEATEGKIQLTIPAAPATLAYVKLNSMGASMAGIHTEYITLWIQCAVYFVLACLVYRYNIRKSHR